MLTSGWLCEGVVLALGVGGATSGKVGAGGVHKGVVEGGWAEENKDGEEVEGLEVFGEEEEEDLG